MNLIVEALNVTVDYLQTKSSIQSLDNVLLLIILNRFRPVFHGCSEVGSLLSFVKVRDCRFRQLCPTWAGWRFPFSTSSMRHTIIIYRTQHLSWLRPRRAPAGLRKPLNVLIILLPLPFTLYAPPPFLCILRSVESSRFQGGAPVVVWVQSNRSRGNRQERLCQDRRLQIWSLRWLMQKGVRYDTPSRVGFDMDRDE